MGLVAKTKRTLSPTGYLYNNLFPGITNTNPILKQEGDVNDTVELCKEIVYKTLSDTKKIAPLLKKSTLEETCKAIFDFFYQNYQYKEDERGVEQLRRPARAWHDRKTGIDCDCFTISISSILCNLGIEHSLRIVKMHGRNFFQHIYVVVPKHPKANMNRRSDYIVIDPVLDKSDYEAPGINFKKDYEMSLPIQYLNGVSAPDTSYSLAAEIGGLGNIAKEDFVSHSGEQANRKFLNKTKAHLMRTRRIIAKNPHMVAKWYKPGVLLGMLDTAIQAWDNHQTREEALEVLSGIEHKALCNSQLQGLGAIEGVFSKIKKGVKKVGQAIKKGAKAVANTAKKVGKAILKLNPISVAARAGFRLAMKTNFSQLASRAYWGFFSKEEAAAKGVPSAYWDKAKQLKDKLESTFVKTLQGKPENLREDIMKGGAKKALKGLDGEPVTTGVSVASAMAFLTPIAVFATKLFGKSDKDKSADGQTKETPGGGKKPKTAAGRFLKKIGDGIKSIANDPGSSDDEGATESATSDESSVENEFEKADGNSSPSFLKKLGVNADPKSLMIFGGLALGAVLLLKKPSASPGYIAPPPPPPYNPYGMRGVKGSKKPRRKTQKKSITIT